jgi:Ser/Thr protein kinase RdoA (MazF antagonist)
MGAIMDIDKIVGQSLADQSAVGAINRPLRYCRSILFMNIIGPYEKERHIMDSTSAHENELRSQLLNLYTSAFPAKEHVQIVSSSIASTDGWESDVFSCTFEYEEASAHISEDVILKIYHGESAGQAATREFQGLQQLSAAGFPAPKALLLAVDDSPFGRPCVLMEKIPGRLLAEVLAESSPAKQQELMTLFCQLFVDLHTLDWKPFVPDPVPYQSKSPLNTWLSEAQNLVEQLQLHAFDTIIDWLWERVGTVTSGRLSVIHWDYLPGNVLLRADGAAYVIDWTQIEVSDFRFDLAWTLLLLSTSGRPERRTVILNEYEHLAGFRIEQIEIFEVIACLKRLGSIFISLSKGATTLGMRPEAEALMRRDVGHIQAVYTVLQERTGRRLPEVERMISRLG